MKLSDWLEIETDPNDPTHIEARRMFPEESTIEQNEIFRQLAERMAELLNPSLTRLIESAKELYALIPDEKAEARKRSREDMNRKRKDLMKRRGK